MGGEPGSTIREHAPLRTVHRTCYAPDISVMVCHPATTTIHFPSRLCSRYTQILNQRIQRLRSVTEIRYLGRPVVHLRIDVDGIFTVPRCIFAVVPNTLQICRLSTRLGRGDEQIAAVVVHQCHHRHILTARKFLQALVGRQRSIDIGWQNQRRSSKLLLISLHMAFLQLCITHQFHLIDIVSIALGCIARHIVIVHKVGGSAHQDGSLGTICPYIRHTFGSESRLDAFLVLSLHLQHYTIRSLLSLMIKRRIQGNINIQSTLSTRLDMANDDAISQRSKGGTGISYAIHHERSRGNRPLQIQVAHKLLSLSLILHVDMQICHRQKAHAMRTWDEGLVDESSRLLFPAIEDEFPHLWQILQGFLAIVVMGTATPESLLIQLDILVRGSAIHHTPQMRVSDRQSLQPLLGRGVIPKSSTIICATRLSHHLYREQ